eukprot:scaffold2322_cov135-Cylindrotheca_fusiformis.AAC.19
MPSSLKRCDWIAQVMEGKDSADALIQTLQENFPATMLPNQWSLDYVRLEETNGSAKRRQVFYTKNALLHAVAQTMPSPPALNPEYAQTKLLVVDSAKNDNATCYLSTLVGPHEGRNLDSVLANWSKRPFQYSSAINPQVAEMIMEILMALIDRPDDESNSRSLRLLDPTCGSGTFLALALERGIEVEAYDCNQQCVDGTHKNLEYLVETTNASKTNLDKIDVSIHDSSQTFPSRCGTIDCVVANLPWGVNSKDFLDQNKEILRSVRSRIEPGTPCAFVTRTSDLGLFNSVQYRILGQAHVPQRDFALPRGRKKQNTKELDRNGRNKCVVTIARAV